MKKTTLSLLVAASMAFAIAGTAVAAEGAASQPASQPADSKAAGDTTTLIGEYNWAQRGKTGDLKAVFTPSGEGEWTVAFYFDFRGEPHVYSGTAQGSLTSGELGGTVRNEDKRRTFTFSGTVEDGVFDGTHAEVEDGQQQDTGTLKLKG